MGEIEQAVGDLRPHLQPGRYVFVAVADPPLEARWVALVREAEGITAVLDQREADGLGLGYDWVSAMITLQAHTSLSLVGLTARVAMALAGAGISCNVVAGRCHDHLFVPIERADEALGLLERLN